MASHGGAGCQMSRTCSALLFCGEGLGVWPAAQGRKTRDLQASTALGQRKALTNVQASAPLGQRCSHRAEPRCGHSQIAPEPELSRGPHCLSKKGGISLWHNHPSTNEAPLPHHAPRTLLILPEKRYCRHTRNHRLLIHEPMRNHIYKEPLHSHATHGSFLRQEEGVL